MNFYNFYLFQLIDKHAKCRKCKIALVQTLHHIDENQKNNSIKNLLPICHKCHLDIDHICDIPKSTLDLLKSFKFRKFKVKKRRLKETTARICPNCLMQYKSNRKNKIFCSKRCKFQNWAKKHPRT